MSDARRKPRSRLPITLLLSFDDGELRQLQASDALVKADPVSLDELGKRNARLGCPIDR
jgi:hypothetical protein